MTAAVVSDLAAESRSRTGLAFALSAAAHLLIAWFLMFGPDFLSSFNAPLASDPPAITVDLVPPADLPKPPAPALPPEPIRRVIPNLSPGKLAKETRPGSETTKDKAAQAGVTVHPKAEPTISERDLVLAQVLRHWRRPPQLALLEDGAVTLAVSVLGDGSLGPPFARSQPWNPGQAIAGYDGMPQGSPQRRVVESIYQALRDAQPLALPPELKAKAPFDLRLDFRFRDVR